MFASYLAFCGIGIQNAQFYERSRLENRRNQVGCQGQRSKQCPLIKGNEGGTAIVPTFVCYFCGLMKVSSVIVEKYLVALKNQPGTSSHKI